MRCQISPKALESWRDRTGCLTRNFVSEILLGGRNTLWRSGIAKSFRRYQFGRLRLWDGAILLVAGKVGAVSGEQALVLKPGFSIRRYFAQAATHHGQKLGERQAILASHAATGIAWESQSDDVKLRSWPPNLAGGAATQALAILSGSGAPHGYFATDSRSWDVGT